MLATEVEDNSGIAPLPEPVYKAPVFRFKFIDGSCEETPIVPTGEEPVDGWEEVEEINIVNNDNNMIINDDDENALNGSITGEEKGEEKLGAGAGQPKAGEPHPRSTFGCEPCANSLALLLPRWFTAGSSLRFFISSECTPPCDFAPFFSGCCDGRLVNTWCRPLLILRRGPAGIPISVSFLPISKNKVLFIHSTLISTIKVHFVLILAPIFSCFFCAFNYTLPHFCLDVIFFILTILPSNYAAIYIF